MSGHAVQDGPGQDGPGQDGPGQDGTGRAGGATTVDRAGLEPFEIRRRSWLFVLLIVIAWSLAGVYGWLGYDRDEPYLYVIAGLLALLALVFVPVLRHLRTPLLVADEHGVRLQDKSGWAGLLWREMGSIAVHPRRGMRAAHVVVQGNDGDRERVVTLGLGTNTSAPEAEIELARRREAASY